MRKGSKTSPRSLGARELLANPRRSHDRHRGLRARCNATPSADSSTYRHQDQHLVIASQSRKSVRRPRRLSNSHGRARPDIRPSSQIVGHRARCDQPLIRQPLNRRTTRCIGSMSNQPTHPRRSIPHSAYSTALPSSSAVSFLGGFRTPAAQRAATSLKRPASETLVWSLSVSSSEWRCC
jgi:hypothetical protein